MTYYEINFDGLVGPSHHYAGLSVGNIASLQHANQVSYPRLAALQGLEKMKLLHDLGAKQFVLPPHQRPNLNLLRRCGYSGTVEEILQTAYTDNPDLLSACYSASSMWAANAATVAPSIDSIDKKCHITPANLIMNMHRSQESDVNFKVMHQLFLDEKLFTLHPPLPRCVQLSDEGAANHTRFCRSHSEPGTHLFVFGRDDQSQQIPKKYPARQSKQACIALAKLHALDDEQVIYAQQHPDAIDCGVFHNDVISVGNENVFLFHEHAFLQIHKVLEEIQQKNPYPMHFIQINHTDMSIETAVKSYLFNSQLVSISGTMHLIAPFECSEIDEVKRVIDNILAADNPIEKVHYIDVRQSMHNGGGPACLRLRVVLNDEELSALPEKMFMSDQLYANLVNWVNQHYREQLTFDDLLEPSLIYEIDDAFSELAQIF